MDLLIGIDIYSGIDMLGTHIEDFFNNQSNKMWKIRRGRCSPRL
jgi:hypothetical protein